MAEERRLKRDPGDPEGPIGEIDPRPRPMAGTGAGPGGYEAAVDRFLEAVFPGVGPTRGETETDG